MWFVPWGAEIKEREWCCEIENGDGAVWSRVRMVTHEWTEAGREPSLKHGGREGDVRWRDEKRRGREREFVLLHFSGHSPQPPVQLFFTFSVAVCLNLKQIKLKLVWHKTRVKCDLQNKTPLSLFLSFPWACVCVCPEALMRNWWAVLKSKMFEDKC